MPVKVTRSARRLMAVAARRLGAERFALLWEVWEVLRWAMIGTDRAGLKWDSWAPSRCDQLALSILARLVVSRQPAAEVAALDFVLTAPVALL